VTGPERDDEDGPDAFYDYDDVIEDEFEDVDDRLDEE
jgi:hypothetical protein